MDMSKASRLGAKHVSVLHEWVILPVGVIRELLREPPLLLLRKNTCRQLIPQAHLSKDPQTCHHSAEHNSSREPATQGTRSVDSTTTRLEQPQIL
jgi:hypothetical protein